MHEAAYICPSCGEDIVVPVDVTSGTQQDYVEDCPVCCCPNVLHVTVLDDGGDAAPGGRSFDERSPEDADIRITAEPEAD